MTFWPGRSSAAGRVRVAGGRSLCSLASSGWATVKMLVIAASGLPGRPTTKGPSSGSRARNVGWPGRWARPSSRKTAPSSWSADRTWSASECPVPPVVMTTSVRASSTDAMPEGASVRAESIAFAVSSTRRSWSTDPPSISTNVGSWGPKASRTWPGSGIPSSTTSLPVSRIVTRGRRRTGSMSWPLTAAKAMCAGLSRQSACRMTSPAATSSPVRRMFCP